MLLSGRNVPKFSEDIARGVIDSILAEPDAFAKTCQCLPQLRLSKAHRQHVEELLDVSRPFFELYTALCASAPGLSGKFWNAYFTFYAAEEVFFACRSSPAVARGLSSWDDSLGSLCASPVAAPPETSDELMHSPIPIEAKSLPSTNTAGSVASTAHGLSTDPSCRLANAFAALVEDEADDREDNEGTTLAASLITGVRFAATQLVLDVREALDGVSQPPQVLSSSGPPLSRQPSCLRLSSSRPLLELSESGRCGLFVSATHVMLSKDIDTPMLKICWLDSDAEDGLAITERERRLNAGFSSYW